MLLFLGFSVYAQSQTMNLYGVVQNDSGLVLSGANVLLDGGDIAVVTNEKGEFAFNNVEQKNHKVVVSFVGYQNAAKEILSHEQHDKIEIILHPSNEKIQEVEVVMDRATEKKRSMSICVDLISEEYLQDNQSGSLMQTLNSIPGVNSMNIGSGLSKPMIRGMGYYRVSVAQNGIKQEGQRWSSHHGIAIDQHTVSHVEIIKGPASLRYGTDAMGGVINVLPDKIPLNQKISGEISLSGKSNNNYIGTTGNLSRRKGDFFFQSTVSYSKYGDFRVSGTDSFLLPAPVSAAEASHKVNLKNNYVINTAGTENAISFTGGVIKKWGKSYFVVSNYNSKAGFVDWEGAKDEQVLEKHLENNYDIQLPYQKVNHFTINHYTTVFRNGNKSELALGYQNNYAREFGYLLDITGNRTIDKAHFQHLDNLDILLNQHSITGNYVYTYNGLEKQQMQVGLNTQYQWQEAGGYNHILPAYQRSTAGAFVIHQFSFTKKWKLNSGARVDFGRIQMEETLNPDPAYGDSIFNPEFDKTYPGTAFSVGLNYLPDKYTVVKINVGRSFRMPSVYELGAYGLHRHEGRFEKGDIDNEPEKAWQFDLGIERKQKCYSLSVSPFANYFTNYLYLNPTSDLRAEGQVYEYNQNKALLTGTEASMHILFFNHISVQADAEFVYAVNLDQMKAIPSTPPFSILGQLGYQFENKRSFKDSKLALHVNYVAAQNYTVPNELSTPAYTIFGCMAKTNFNMGEKPVQFLLKVNNIFDTKYYNHISFYRRLRIPEPGRNIQLNITMPF